MTYTIITTRSQTNGLPNSDLSDHFRQIEKCQMMIDLATPNSRIFTVLEYEARQLTFEALRVGKPLEIVFLKDFEPE